jgi:hypothetical protein
MEQQVRSILDAKTKPVGSLGLLEDWAVRYVCRYVLLLELLPRRAAPCECLLITCVLRVSSPFNFGATDCIPSHLDTVRVSAG